MKFFCSHPFTSLIVAEDNAMPCCVFGRSEKIDNYFNSDQIKKVKSQLLNNTAPLECANCVKSEAANNHSFRTHKEKYNSNEGQIRSINSDEYFDIQDIQIITSNICNLLCLPCETGSYVRRLEFKKLGLTKSIPVVYKNSIIKNHLVKFTNLSSVTLTGGEPFVDEVAMDIIDYLIQSGRSQQISIDLNTNLTMINNESLLKLKNNFKEVLIKGSIDGFGKFNDYLRYPSQWQQIKNSVDLIQQLNIPFIITAAISNLALINFDLVVKWAADQNIEDIVTSIVTTPSVLNCNRLPENIKQKLLIKYVRLLESNIFTERTKDVINACISMCQTSGCTEEEFKQTIIWLEKHDQLRGTNFRKIWPELNDY